MSKSVADAVELGKEVEIVDLRFTDLLGTWQHGSMPARKVTEALFEEGVGFDGSSVRAFQEIHESDMVLVPDPKTAFVDELLGVPTLVLICDILQPVTRQPYTRNARNVAKKAEAYLLQSGIAAESYWGPEAEFFVFNSVRYGGGTNEAYYHVDSAEGWWNSGQAGSLGQQIAPKRGYWSVPPTDTLHDVRSEIVLLLEKFGLQVEMHHHEVASAGQSEITMKYDTLTRMADNLMIYKYVVKGVARKNGLTATFMPKPLFEDNGSGMHVHTSLWKGEKNVFFDEAGYAQISDTAKYYIGGLLKHAPALLAFAAPTTNSYRRLVPGYEAPVIKAYSQRNRSACCRIPVFDQSPVSKRIEFRPPDASCNPYLCFAALLMAGLDGVQNQIDPGEPMDKDLYDLPPEEAKSVEQLPGSLAAVLDALEADHEFLLKGDVFTPDLIEAYVDYKRKVEVDSVRMRPHPHEFTLYYDI